MTVDGVGDGASTTVSLLRAWTPRLASRRHRRVTRWACSSSTSPTCSTCASSRTKARSWRSPTTPSPIADGENPLLPLVRVDGLRLVTSHRGLAMRARLRQLQWSYPNEQFAFMAQRVDRARLVELALAAWREPVRRMSRLPAASRRTSRRRDWCGSATGLRTSRCFRTWGMVDWRSAPRSCAAMERGDARLAARRSWLWPGF